MSRVTGADRVVGFVRGKARRGLDQAQDKQGERFILGNKCADHYARVAANESAFSDADCDMIKIVTSCYTKLGRGIGKALAECPPYRSRWGSCAAKLWKRNPSPRPRPLIILFGGARGASGDAPSVFEQ
eukprot:627874-Pyramimonas_sp.AAC.1